MLILIDIKPLTDLTPGIDNTLRMEAISHWLTHDFNLIIPEAWQFQDIESFRMAHQLVREYGKVPLNIPVNLLFIEDMQIRGQTLLLTVDEAEFYQRNPELCRPRNTSLRYRTNSGFGRTVIQGLGGIR